MTKTKKNVATQTPPEEVKPIQKKVVKKVQEKEPEDDLEVEDETSEGEEELSEEDEQEAFVQHVMHNDVFKLKTGNLFKEEEVLSIELPKFILDSTVKNLTKISDKSSVTMVLMFNQFNPDLGKRVLQAVRNGFKEFKIIYPGFEEGEESVWEITNAKVAGVDLGSLMTTPREEPKCITIDISYDQLIVDKETIFQE